MLAYGLQAPHAQARSDWPDKAITMIVPYPAGGVVDVVTRIVSAEMAASLQQPVVVMNRIGANGNIAADAVGRAAPDGYTMLVSAPFLLINPLIEASLRWQPDMFQPVGGMARSADYFVVPADAPHRSVRDYLDEARQNAREPLRYGIAGKGTPQALALEILKRSTQTPMDAVLYQGAPLIVNDLVTARVSMAVLPALVALPHIRSGKLRALAIMGDQRSQDLPEVATIAESGFGQATVFSWYGIHAPSRVPATVVHQLEAALRKALAAESVTRKMLVAGTTPAYLDTAGFSRFIGNESRRWSEALNRYQIQ